ncbi:NAD(P)-dependent oxidoreductase [Paraburkholderia sp. CNPSo 3281]|uniref:NAD(P)-dependent oxidoreductase n=1 Tax=Paraburkholderia sp. CNPSo 3281 TaxID=2940933 RepID=UPI0020B7DD90|nr:NAD(P)-binding domain-containing protein [Paraburkholderia sp. CNPSo 3281]MCP3717365.1 NAD(P)-binding domain-containing protein [Paraburkholderia sp. CNPSo 3281]
MAATVTAQAISVIGLGAMGAALAKALLAANHRVTVWNRTASKSVALGEVGARIAHSAAEAIDASQVVVVCVLDYGASDSLLRAPDVVARLKGKTIIQFTTGTPEDAQDASEWAREHGVAYLDGSIGCYPKNIGTPDGSILYAGSRSTFETLRHTLANLSGHALFVGERFGNAAILDGAVVGSFSLGATLGFLYGAAVCDAEGISLDTYLSLASARLPFVEATLQTCVQMIKKGNYSGSQATLDTWAAGIGQLVEYSHERGTDSRYPQEVLARLQQAVAMGHGQHELAAVFECFRKPLGYRS